MAATADASTTTTGIARRTDQGRTVAGSVEAKRTGARAQRCYVGRTHVDGAQRFFNRLYEFRPQDIVASSRGFDMGGEKAIDRLFEPFDLLRKVAKTLKG